MILESIAVENFLSHGSSEVCFTTSRLWLIGGENGAGKSALFDALEYALYGKHRGGGQNDRLLIKQGTRRAKIMVVFQHNGERYRVIHEIDHKDGNKGGRLDIWDAAANDWKPKNVGTGVAAVWNWAERELSSHDYFRSAIFLHQNETAHFLRGSANDRGQRFAALVDLSRYTELSQKAQALVEAAKIRREAARRQDLGLGDLSDETLRRLEEEMRAAGEAFTEAETAYTSAKQAVRGAEAWAALQDRRQQQEQLICELQTLRRDSETIRAAADRVAAWDQAAIRLQTYWDRRSSATTLRAKAEAKRAKAEQTQTEKDGAESEYTVIQQRLAAIEQDDLPAAQRQQREAERRQACLDLEQRIATTLADIAATQREIAQLDGADDAYEDWQRRSRALKPLKELVDVRTKLAEMEHAQSLAQIAHDGAVSDVTAARERLEATEHELEEVERLRDQYAEQVVALDRDIARLDGQIESHGKLTGQEPECPICAQPLDETTFQHVQNVLKDDRVALEQKHAELNTIAPLHKEAEEAMKRLKRDQREQKRAVDATNTAERTTQTTLAETSKQVGLVGVNLKNAEQSLLAENPTLADEISIIDDAWIAAERVAVKAALPEAQAAAERLTKVRTDLAEARAKVTALREQRMPDTAPLADEKASETIAALLQETTDNVETAKRQVDDLEQERTDLAHDMATKAGKIARLTESAAQAYQRAKELEAEARTAASEGDRLYAELCSQWTPLLGDRGAYESEVRIIEELRPLARKASELDQARGRLDGAEEELRRIGAEEPHVPPGHQLPVEQASQMEKDANQNCAVVHARRTSASEAIADFQRKRQERETCRRQMTDADQEWQTFNELAELLKPSGRIQKVIAEQEQRKIAVEANLMLELLNDPLRIRIDQARRGKDSQDVTIIDTSDLAGGNPESDGRARRYFEFLSGGEKFRVALALALALHRRIASGAAGTLIVDEGFGALDGDRRDRLAMQLTDTAEGILGLKLAHSLIICSHASEVQRHFRDNCWMVEKHAGTACVWPWRESLGEHTS